MRSSLNEPDAARPALTKTMPAGSLQGLVLALDDLRATCEELAGKGVEFDQALEERPWGWEAVVRDPDGNRLVLQQA